MSGYPAPPTPRVHSWVNCGRTASGVVEIMRVRDNPRFYRMINADTETVVFRGTWKDALDFAAGKLEGPFSNESR